LDLYLGVLSKGRFFREWDKNLVAGRSVLYGGGVSFR
jgi:hypothetical protein